MWERMVFEFAHFFIFLLYFSVFIKKYKPKKTAYLITFKFVINNANLKYHV